MEGVGGLVARRLKRLDPSGFELQRLQLFPLNGDNISEPFNKKWPSKAPIYTLELNNGPSRSVLLLLYETELFHSIRFETKCYLSDSHKINYLTHIIIPQL
jgi:hypothetical protein